MRKSRQPRSPIGGKRLVLGAALLLASFKLRPAVTSLGPVLPEVMRSTGMYVDAGGQHAGLLPVPCLARRFGMERTVLGMVLLLAAGALLRLAENTWSLFVAAILAGAAIGVIDVLLPVLVKRDFPDRVALMTATRRSPADARAVM